MDRFNKQLTADVTIFRHSNSSTISRSSSAMTIINAIRDLSHQISDMNWVNGGTCAGSSTRSLDAPIPMKMSDEGPNEPSKQHDNDNDDDDDENKNNDHDHKDDDSQDIPEGYMTIGAAVGMTFGVAALVFVSMAVTMCCMSKKFKKGPKHMQNTVVV